MVDNDSATRKLFVYSFFGVAQGAVFRLLLGNKFCVSSRFNSIPTHHTCKKSDSNLIHLRLELVVFFALRPIKRPRCGGFKCLDSRNPPKPEPQVAVPPFYESRSRGHGLSGA